MKRIERLQGFKAQRDDKYFTLYDGIAVEVCRYKTQQKGKWILLPCDMDESNKEEIVYYEEGYVLERSPFYQRHVYNPLTGEDALSAINISVPMS